MTPIVTTVAVLIAAIPAVFMLGMRGKWPFVLDAVRAMNKRFMNPRQMKSAGAPGAYAAVIHHTGRTSGKQYQTPVGVVHTDDEFLIGLPYGTRPDWVRNVMKTGSAVIDHEGETYRVDRPEVVPTSEVADRFGDADRRTQKLFAMDQVLLLHTAGWAG